MKQLLWRVEKMIHKDCSIGCLQIDLIPTDYLRLTRIILLWSAYGLWFYLMTPRRSLPAREGALHGTEDATDIIIRQSSFQQPSALTSHYLLRFPIWTEQGGSHSRRRVRNPFLSSPGGPVTGFVPAGSS